MLSSITFITVIRKYNQDGCHSDFQCPSKAGVLNTGFQPIVLSKGCGRAGEMAQCVKHLLCQYEWQLASVTTASSTTKGQRQADLRSLPASLGDPVSSRFNAKPCLRKGDEEQRGFFLQ